jgi:hypothetical protein
MLGFPPQVKRAIGGIRTDVRAKHQPRNSLLAISGLMRLF